MVKKRKYDWLKSADDANGAKRQKNEGPQTSPQRSPPEAPPEAPPKRKGGVHARGGTHSVPPEHLTHTKWDYENRNGMEAELKTRPGLYKKDLKKHVIAKLLAEDDKRIRLEEKKREREAKKAIEKAKKEQALKEERIAEERKKINAEKAEKAAWKKYVHDDRERRREEGESDVSETTESEEELLPRAATQTYGEVLSDSMSDTTPASTTTVSDASPLAPHARLRIFEWPDTELPSLTPPEPDFLPTGWENPNYAPRLQPARVPYAIMNVVTTRNGVTLELPGRRYPESVGADYVPGLTQEVKNYARNGVLIGTLKKAFIESGVAWAQRTHIEYWNARITFKLPPRTSTVPLADVYSKWRKYKEPVKANLTAKERRLLRKRMQRQKRLDVYASSDFTPPISYMPVHLDYPFRHDDDYDGPRTLKRLFYIRFPGSDLPHYYFWVGKGQWKDPTTPNPDWLDNKEWLDEQQREQDREQERLFERNNGFLVPTTNEEQGTHRPFALDKTKTRIKKTKGPRKFPKNKKRLPKHLRTRFDITLWTVERQLYEDGLARTLYNYRDKWRKDGKGEAWKHLIDNMPQLYPSGKLPDTAPVHVDRVPPTSLAEKIASIEVPARSRPVSPIQGDEPWTTKNDELWDIVDLQSPTPSSTSDQEIQESNEDVQGLQRGFASPGPDTPNPISKRRASKFGRRKTTELDTWLKSVNPNHVPPTDTHMPVSPQWTSWRPKRGYERENWELAFDNAVEKAAPGRKRSPSTHSSTNPAVPEMISYIESMPVTELKYKLSSRMDGHLRRDKCGVCNGPLDVNDEYAAERHYQRHYDEANDQCPFCGMEWSHMGSHWKASHIFVHDFEDPHQRRRRSSSNQLLYSIPRIPERRRSSSACIRVQPRRASKVHFSPVIVGKRTSYNDQSDVGMEADVSEVASLSPKKGLLKKGVGKTAKTGSTTTKAAKPSELSYIEPSPSGSSHIPSPYLPSFPRYPREHLKASFDPRKWSTSTLESLEYYTGRRGTKAKKGGAKKTTKIAKPSTKGSTKGKGKQKANIEESIDEPPKRTTRGRKAKLPDPTYRDEPPSSEPLSPILRRPRKPSDPSYQYQSPSTTPSPAKPKKKKAKAPTERCKGSISGIELEAPLAPTASRNVSNPSTVSNVSTKSDERRLQAIQNPELENIPGSSGSGSKKRGSAASHGSQTSKKQKLSDGTPDALYGEGSDITLPEYDDFAEGDYLKFLDAPLFQSSDDPLTGNPFAPPPNKSKAKSKAKTKTTKVSKAKSKVTKAPKKPKTPKLTPKRAALAFKKATAEKELTTSRAARRRVSTPVSPKTIVRRRTLTPISPATSSISPKTKTTISGRPFVEPLIIAPAQRVGNASPKPIRTSSSTTSTPSHPFPSDNSDIIDWLEPPTPSPKRGLNEQLISISARGRRSSAPTPSPSRTTSSSKTPHPISTSNIKRPEHCPAKYPGLGVEAARIA